MRLSRRGAIHAARQATAAGYAAEVLADSPLSYWRLEETSGSTVADETGTRTGTVYGANLDVAGQVGSGAFFDRIDDYIDVGNPPAGMTAVTVEALVNANTGAGAKQILCADSSGARAWQFLVASTTGLVNFTKIGGGVVPVSGTSNVVGSWHHVAATYDGATIRVYVDGVEEANAAGSGTITTGSEPLDIGRSSRGPIAFFGGTLDEVALYDTALSAARIQAHYNAAGVA